MTPLHPIHLTGWAVAFLCLAGVSFVGFGVCAGLWESTQPRPRLPWTTFVLAVMVIEATTCFVAGTLAR